MAFPHIPEKHQARRPFAAAEIARVLDAAPALAPTVLRGDTRLTRPWRHGPLHESLAPMQSHVIMTYYSPPRDISYRCGSERLANRTRPGAVTLIPEGCFGRWDIEGDIKVSHIYLSEERLQTFAAPLANGKRVELFGRVGYEDVTTARILELLAREAENDDASSRLFIEQAIDLLCVQLIRNHSNLSSAPAPPSRLRGLAEWQVRRVTAYMRDNLGAEIGLDELAALVSLSRSHFCTAFRLATGLTPHQWLTAERIDR
ncbi:AraC family transcriptional regulator, partial [bacterium]|nr:AraC family transcriptional regulator [bacterium]